MKADRPDPAVSSWARNSCGYVCGYVRVDLWYGPYASLFVHLPASCLLACSNLFMSAFFCVKFEVDLYGLGGLFCDMSESIRRSNMQLTFVGSPYELVTFLGFAYYVVRHVRDVVRPK